MVYNQAQQVKSYPKSFPVHGLNFIYIQVVHFALTVQAHTQQIYLLRLQPQICPLERVVLIYDKNNTKEISTGTRSAALKKRCLGSLQVDLIIPFMLLIKGR